MANEGYQNITAVSDKEGVGTQQSRESRKIDEVRAALQRWQEAAHEWSEIYRCFKQETGSKLFERKRQLRLLEKRLNDAADAYEKARRGADQYSLTA